MGGGGAASGMDETERLMVYETRNRERYTRSRRRRETLRVLVLAVGELMS